MSDSRVATISVNAARSSADALLAAIIPLSSASSWESASRADTVPIRPSDWLAAVALVMVADSSRNSVGSPAMPLAYAPSASRPVIGTPGDSSLATTPCRSSFSWLRLAITPAMPCAMLAVSLALVADDSILLLNTTWFVVVWPIAFW